MAKPELIKGHFTGRVGSFVGSKNKGGEYVKARVFSKAPLTETQGNCLQAFGYLQRFASPLAKLTASTPFTTVGKGSYYNRVCSLFKGAISTHEFLEASLTTAVSSVDPYTVTLSSVDIATGACTATVKFPDTAIEKASRKIVAIVYNEECKKAATATGTAEQTEWQFQWQPSVLTSGFLFMVEVIKNNEALFPLSRDRKRNPYYWRNATVTQLASSS